MRILMLSSTLLLAACGSSDTIRYKDSEGNDRTINVQDKDGTRSVSSDDGLTRAKGTRGSAKARFPAFAPQYPGANVQSVVDMDVGTGSTGGVKQHIITMASPDTPEKVIAFYRTSISASGKSVKEAEGATGPMLVVGGTNPLDAEGYVTAMANGAAGTSVNVVVQERVRPQ
ncbi:MAG: hypothetical protein RL481_1773 [Pseudomonadota bacterium]|jgi:hypothetical protein